MSARPFYTRCPELAVIRRMVQENLDPKRPFEDYSQLFSAVEKYYSEQSEAEDRGGWFTPRILGGFPISHTPPHVIFWILGVYLHLATGDRDAVPFLSGPLDMNGATAVTLEPSEAYLVADWRGAAHPVTDFLSIVPALTPRNWIMDTYGLPQVREGMTIIGWHSAAQPFLEAVCSGQIVLDAATGRLLDPLAAFTEEDQEHFFSEPVNVSRLERHRDRLTEVFRTPLDAFKLSSASATRVIRAYLER